MEKVLIVGAGGHGRAVADTIELMGMYEIAGFLDDVYPEKHAVWDYPLLGATSDLSAFTRYAGALVVAIGNNKVRKSVFERAKAAGFTIPSIVHPSAVVSRRAVIGEGCCLMAGSVVGTEAVLGQGCVVNVNASVDHHCRLDDFAHLGVGVHLAGGVRVGASAWMQAGSSAGYLVEVPAGSVVPPGTGLSADPGK
jgi:sugar O-acyltransferase (sialic acid O-acetyltransferase NeuD family)